MLTPLEALKATGTGFRRGWELPTRDYLSKEDSDDYLAGLACIGTLSIAAVVVTCAIKVVTLPFKILDKVLKK